MTFFEWNLSLFGGFVLAAWLVLRGMVQISAAKDTVQSTSASSALWWIMPTIVLPILLLTGFGIYDICEYFQRSMRDVLLRERNFFGTLQVEDYDSDSADHCHVLRHGRITHGMQFMSDDGRHLPTTYYAPETGVGRTIGFYRESKNLHGMRIGAVGLGTGTLAAYAEDGDSIRFYEINPAVIEITEPGKWFTYLKDCKARGGKYEIELGDARLTLERELQDHKLQKFHVLVLDAFSGDAIPMHLLTEEAMQSYAQQLAKASDGDEEGALSDSHYESLRRFRAGGIRNGGKVRDGSCAARQRIGSGCAYTSDWMILTKNPELLKALAAYAEPVPEERKPPVKKKKPILWTDGQSNLFEVLK